MFESWSPATLNDLRSQIQCTHHIFTIKSKPYWISSNISRSSHIDCHREQTSKQTNKQAYFYKYVLDKLLLFCVRMSDFTKDDRFSHLHNCKWFTRDDAKPRIGSQLFCAIVQETISFQFHTRKLVIEDTGHLKVQRTWVSEWC